MQTTIFLPTAQGLNVIESSGGVWSGRSTLQGVQLQCVAVDAKVRGRVYCGSFGDGLFLSEDAGRSWRQGAGLQHARVTALHASADGTLYAGTEPSAVYRSTDCGETWMPLSSLLTLPSAPTWSFPPRPETNHIQAILADADEASRLHVAVEAGALLLTEDAGDTWRDRVASGPADTHTLIADPTDSRHVFSAAGDGCFESLDSGASWEPLTDGLHQTYCWSVAVHPADTQVLLLSASQFASTAHSPQAPSSFVYRRSGGGPWQPAMQGLDLLPQVRIPVLAAGPHETGTFFLACEGEVYRTTDKALSWERLPVDWSGSNRIERHSLSIAVSQSA